jgi:twitching motility two-component system response regulator PilG
MRLEFEPNTTVMPLVQNGVAEVPPSASPEFQTLLKMGIAAAKNGDRENARELLTEAVEIHSLNEEAWMWLGCVSDYPEELIAYLNNVLTINPANERAKQWLAETESTLAKSSFDEVYDLGDVDTLPNMNPGHPALPSLNTDGPACPYCFAANDANSFSCKSCRALLTLSDIDALLLNPNAGRARIHETISEMEEELTVRTLDDKEMTTLGIGHLNLRNFDKGLECLHEVLSRDTNNVILSGQLNAIAIRLEEIRRQDEIHETKPKGKTILVVDDSPTVRKLISSKLEKSGHSVVCAVDGIDGLAKITESLPDLVFLDISMPRMDGYDVCKEIRANPTTKNLPVVMISGKDGFFDKVRGKMAGTSGYVTKPFGPDTLMKALETYLLPEQIAAVQ